MTENSQNLKDSFQIIQQEGGIIEVKVLKAYEKKEDYIKQAVLGVQEIMRICKENPEKKYKILIDLSSIGTKGASSVETRRIYQKIMSYPQIEKVAIIGLGNFSRAIINVLFRTTGKEGVKWFSNPKEALSWLKKYHNPN